ncbi:hypothetical protein MKUB_52090 [Mycobacterium kubicae]|uniref:Cation transporter n=2 Tax=Mycobacterium kubicae TaxID=120959 RepID=A0AAX1J5B0_9MYCO|nr:cation transporter [Mycobacterium kubicae]QPI36347.1 cation transporter [Mycobacterium kubicae]GFG67719.1 hypothetical protein MKUB_52090 [Mycobacterium kubicae]
MDLKVIPIKPLAESSAAGCACCRPRRHPADDPTTPPKDNDMIGTVASYSVTGMTCGHCVQAVTEELTALPGVSAVSVDLVPGDTSTVTITSDTPVTNEQIAAALSEAGDYHLSTA